MTIFFVLLALRVWHHNVIDADDRTWLMHAGEVMMGHEERAPPAGRYNAGQKVLFWLLSLCMVGLAGHGLPVLAPLLCRCAADAAGAPRDACSMPSRRPGSSFS